MKKRLLACVLSLSLLLNLSVPALASSDLVMIGPDGEHISPDSLCWDVIHVPESFDYSPVEDIEVNPEDYILGSGASAGSLGVTLSIGQIAALIAAGGGVIYASQYMDDLGRHLQNALDSAAAAIPNGVDLLAQWTANAVNGNIALASAPPWIALTILQTIHGLITNISSLTSSYYSSTGYAPPVSGVSLPAGSPLHVGHVNVSSDGSISRSYMLFDTDVVPFSFIAYKTTANGVYVQFYTYILVDPAYPGSTYVDQYGKSRSFSSMSNFGYTCQANGLYRYIYDCYSMSGSFSDQATLNAFNTFVLPGSIVVDYGTSVNQSFVKPYIEAYLSGDVIDGMQPLPDGVEVAPDVLVGGLPELWVGQGLGADVITFPDIMIDGSGVLAPDTSLEGEAAWDVAIDGVLEDLKTGELSWSDYWLDISDSVPVAKVEDETTGDIVDKPIGDDGSLKDPVVVPDYSTNLEDYTLDLKGIFPFCIPFDIYNFLSCLAADPVAPSWDWKLVVPFTNGDYSITVDLSPFDSVAVVFRNFELLIFIVGLGIKTRDIIKG